MKLVRAGLILSVACALPGADAVQVRWVRETLASASYRYPWIWVDIPEHKVGDILDPSQPFALTDRAFRALWVTVKTPSDVAPGIYHANLVVKDAVGAEERCALAIEVLSMTLPPRRRMYLDIWQTPWTIARYYNVKPFSPEHYARMEPIFRELAAAGQKAITTTITDYPWNIRSTSSRASSSRRPCVGGSACRDRVIGPRQARPLPLWPRQVKQAPMCGCVGPCSCGTSKRRARRRRAWQYRR